MTRAGEFFYFVSVIMGGKLADEQNVENEGIEPSASCVQGRRSTPELIPHVRSSLHTSTLESNLL